MIKYIKYLVTEKQRLWFCYGTVCKITISIRFFLLFVVLFVLPSILSAQITTNFTILDSLTRTAAGRICTETGGSITVTVKDHNAAWLLRTRLAETCTDIRISRADTAQCVVGFTMFGVHYERLPSAADSLLRTCTVAIVGTYIRSNGTLASLSSNKYTYQDVISENDLATAEAGGYDFTRASVPPTPASFLRDIIEPFTIITTAALTVFLLFSVRSQ